MLNATSNWSDGHVFDDRLSLKYFELKYDGLHYILSLYSKKYFLTTASGATPIRSVIAGMMAPEKSWCLVESPARWKPQEEGVMNTAARFSLN
jgi:hypothetical protein